MLPIQRSLQPHKFDLPKRRRAARGTLKLDATLAGFEPALFAGGRIDLRGVRDPLQGEWHIDQVRHQLSDGLTTSLRARRKFDD